MKKQEQLSLINENTQTDNEPVVCLSMKFENDNERRVYFRNELRKKLTDLKQIGGFPIGEVEEIIALSDPPYYTACPNPWILEFYEEKTKNRMGAGDDSTIIEPYTNDVKEGKNDPIYNAHSYHTKVPYKAIIRYLLHFTRPGDIVFDGFSGSGMTGVASKLITNTEVLQEMGYVLKDNVIYEQHENELIKVSTYGERYAILSELAPAASFIASVYNSKISEKRLEQIERAIDEFENAFSYLYLTPHTSDEKFLDEITSKLQHSNTLFDFSAFLNNVRTRFGKINYVVYSDVYVCPSCSNEVNNWELTVIEDTKNVRKEPICPHCQAEIKRSDLERVWESRFDKYLNKVVSTAKQVPVLLNYSFNKKRYEKKLDKYDIALLNKLDEQHITGWFPTEDLPNGYNLAQPQRSHGFKNVHNFYHVRTLHLVSEFLSIYEKLDLQLVQFSIGSILPKLTKMNRYMPQHGSRALVGPMANVLYLPPMHVENNMIDQIIFQFKKIKKALTDVGGNIISTQSSSEISLPDNSVDYVFIDPPFGANIMYSDLNFIRESWLKVKTNNEEEAIENSFQNKNIDKYKQIMVTCLKEVFRILKPGKWITVEFSNTKASVWNSIQAAIQEAGFVIASVDALDKTRGGLYSMITTVGVKQDLIISAYKPSKELQGILKNDNELKGVNVYDFVKSHLQFLPITKGSRGELSFIAERDPRIIYDRMIAYFVRNNITIPMSSADFQNGIVQRFPIRDGMIFLESQVVEYDKKRKLVKDYVQTNLFVSDESSAIEWIRQQLLKKPQTRQDIHPKYMMEIQHIAKHEMLPELDDLLHQNFLRYDGEDKVPPQIVAYLRRAYKDLRGLEPNKPYLIEKAMNRWYVPDPNKQADLEKLREKSLLREFDGYIELLEGKKKLKQFRTEAIRAGFKKAWSDKDFEKIVKIGERLPESVIQEDDKLLMYFDNAQIRLGL